jgi:3-methyladenine DNA glycosylase AlkD
MTRVSSFWQVVDVVAGDQIKNKFTTKDKDKFKSRTL